MSNDSPHPTESRVLVWIGRVLSTLPVLLLIMSGVMKVTKNPQVTEGFTKMGYDPQVALGIGIVELICTALYIIPHTAPVGAILLTGYLGGATATHLRIGEPWFTPVILGVVLWVGLVLRDGRLQSVLPWKR